MDYRVSLTVALIILSVVAMSAGFLAADSTNNWEDSAAVVLAKMAASTVLAGLSILLFLMAVILLYT